MGNFEAQEDFAPQTLILPVGEYRLVLGPVLGYRYDPRAVLPITPQAFAALCRELDMGGQYQAHLQAVLAPAPSSVLGAWPQDSIRRQIADALLVQVNCAQIKGAIDTSTAALLEALLGEGIAPSWQGGAVQVCRLRALVTWVHSGTPLAGAVLVRSQADPEGPCVLYLPGAEAEPLKQFDSFAAMAIALRQRLRDRGFQAFFQRFVPCAERGEFFARLLNTLSPQPFSLLFPKPREDDPDADIGVRADALATGLVEQLRLDMLATVLGDARWCVVPTDDEDRKTRDRRLQQMLALGLDVQREARIEAMERILAVWQRDPGHINYEDDQVSGYELDLSDLPLGQLPALTADFSHVQQLVLDGVGTNHDPSPFLRAFTSLRGVDMCRNGLLTIPEAVATLPMLRDLHLGANQLLASDDMFRSLAGLSSLESLDVQNMPLEIPPGAFAQLARLPSLRDLALSGTAQALSDQTLVGVASLSRLQYLWLRNTGLVMSAARGQLLAQLHDLRWMDLADNPLGESLDLSPFTRLISVDLSRCRLTGWPAGLTELMAAQPLYLNTVLLTQNPIAEVPVLRGLSMFAAGARNVPTLRISREALSEASLDRLLAVDVEPVEAHGQVLADWLQGSTAQVRLRAEALREQPEARFFMTALDRSVETQDYRADRQAGRVRIQQLLNALDDEPEGEAAVDRAALRNQLFDVGEEVMTTCGDGVQLFLRRCETLVQVYDVAQQAAADGDLGRLAQLGRRFYREHLLDEVAGRLYNARVTRRQVLFPDAVARAATAQELAALTPADEHGAPALAAMDEGDSASLVDVPDEAEIRLRLRIDLAQRLDLPPQAQHMRYFQAMSETIRERVTEAVNNADTPHARRAWILGQAWWVHCVQRHWQVRFQALREHWYAGHAYLLALQDADGELEPVPADVLRPLETFFPEHAWQREGVPQRVVLTEEESEAARQRLDSAQHEAERSLLEGLSAPVLGDDEAA